MGHCLGLTTGAQISVCKAPSFSAGPAVSGVPLTGMETVQERPLLSWEGENSLLDCYLLTYLLKVILSSQVGLNNGDGIHFYEHHLSLTPNIRYIYGQSNVGMQGRLVYNVSGDITGA